MRMKQTFFFLASSAYDLGSQPQVGMLSGLSVCVRASSVFVGGGGVPFEVLGLERWRRWLRRG